MTAGALRTLQAYFAEELPSLLVDHGVPGAAVAAYADGAVIDHAAGTLNGATGVATTADSLFQIGSITKVWTATLVMQLVDDGLLDLDAPVRNYLPDFRIADKDAAATITSRQLLCHTAGFEGDIFTDTGPGDDCVERFVADLAHVPQVFPPGKLFSYNNAGYCVLGRIVEVLRGAPYERCLRKHLIDPLSLTHVATGAHEAILHRAAVGHLPADETGQPRPAPVWSLPRSIVPAGGVLAMRARDLLGFVRLHLNNGLAPDGRRLLSEAGVKAMQQAHVPLPLASTSTAWGLGWELYERPGATIIGHDGGTIGQSAFLLIVPDRDVAVVLLTNGGDNRPLYRTLFRYALRTLADVDLPASPTPPTERTEIDARHVVGRYATDFADQSVTQDEAGRIWLSITPRSALARLVAQPQQFELVHYATDTLISAQPAGGQHRLVGFVGRDAGGRAQYLIHSDRAVCRAAGQ